jgi:hypothetical protein
MTLMKVIAEQEHYLLISDGERFTVIERRAGKFYPLCTGVRHGFDLDDETVAELTRRSGSYSERDARCRLVEVASQWRNLFELVR